MSSTVRIGLLGPLEVSRDGVDVPVASPRQRGLLALLALSAGHPVATERIVDTLWEDDLPRNPRASVHTCVSRLRALLGDDVVRTDPAGYRLAVDPGQVDALLFSSTVADARIADTPEGERTLLDRALDLWRDRPFGDIDLRALREREEPVLLETYVAAAQRRAEIDADQGLLEEALTRLLALVNAHPLREPVWVRLLRMLADAGRRAEALEHYERVRCLLADELGTDPGPELQAVHRRLLEVPDPVADEISTEPRPPRQLPADLTRFCGRESELARLDQLADQHSAGSAVTVAVYGVGAVGKSSLVIHWGHRARERFPDGQLFLDLAGFGPHAPLSTYTAAADLLIGLGVPSHRVPPDLAGAAGMLRSLLAERRMLLVLDNARDAQHVRPLLPGGETMVVVTSRSQLRGLVSRDGAQRLPVDPLDMSASAALLRSGIGPDPTAVPPQILDELAGLCGHLPLALSVAAERVGRQPDLPLRDLVAALRTGSSKLGALTDDDDPLSDLRAVFSWSYIALAPEAQRMFRLLGLYPGPDLGVPAAAALAGTSAAEARRLLDRLVAASLLRVVRPGRFRLHDLVREYAQELAGQDPVDVRRPALTRLLDWYTHTAIATMGEAVQGVRRPTVLIPPDPPGDGVVPTRFTSLAAADEWLATEWPGVSPAVDAATTYGLHRHAAQLVCRWLDELHRRPPPEALRLQETALSAAVEIGDQALVALLHRDLGVTHAHAGDLVAAEREYDAARSLFERVGHLQGVERTLLELSRIRADAGRMDEADAVAREGLELSRRLGDQVAEAGYLIHLSHIHVLTGGWENLLEYAPEAFDRRHVLSPANQAVAFFNLAEARLYEGRHDDVRALLAQSRTELPLDSHLTAIMHFILCRNEIAAACPVKAREHLDAAHTAYEQALRVATRPLQLTRADLVALQDSLHPAGSTTF